MIEQKFYELTIGSGKYIATMVGETVVKVRIPLQIYKAPTEENMREYTLKLHKRVEAAYKAALRGKKTKIKVEGV